MRKKITVSFHDVLKSGSIWVTPSRRLAMVMYITNTGLDQDKYPSYVVFRIDDEIMSCRLQAFKKTMKYVRQDEVAASLLFDIFFYEITRKEQTVVEDIDDTEELETDDVAISEEDTPAESYSVHVEYTDNQNQIYSEYLSEQFIYYEAIPGNIKTHRLGFLGDSQKNINCDYIQKVFDNLELCVLTIGDSQLVLKQGMIQNVVVSRALVNGKCLYMVNFDEVTSTVEKTPTEYDGITSDSTEASITMVNNTDDALIASTTNQELQLVEDDSDEVEVVEVEEEDDGGVIAEVPLEAIGNMSILEEGEVATSVIESEVEPVVENPTEPLTVDNNVVPLTFDDSKLPKQVRKALDIEPNDEIVRRIERAVDDILSDDEEPITTEEVVENHEQTADANQS